MGEAMQRRTARAVAAGAIATLALIAVFAVTNNEVARESDQGKDDEVIGDALLRQEAAVFDQKRALISHQKGMASIDDMLHRFQTTPSKTEDELTNELVKNAPHKNKLALDPAALGIGIARELPTGQEMMEGSNLLQEEAEEWNPSGQGGLAAQIKAAQEEEEENEAKEDGIKGDGVLGAVGIKTADDVMDARDMLFVQVEARDDSGASWTPSGQNGLSHHLKAAHQADALAQQKAESDVFQGDGILSAVGMKEQPRDVPYDMVPQFDASDLMHDDVLTQVSASWSPSGQAGLSDAIKHAKDEDEAEAIKEDGLGGDTVLTAANAPDTLLIQRSAEDDKVLNWKPKGILGLKGAHKVHQGVHHLHTAKPEKAQIGEHEFHWQMKDDDGLDGDGILSAVSLGHHLKESSKAEFTRLGSVADTGLGDLLKD